MIRCTEHKEYLSIWHCITVQSFTLHTFWGQFLILFSVSDLVFKKTNPVDKVSNGGVNSFKFELCSHILIVLHYNQLLADRFMVTTIRLYLIAFKPLAFVLDK